MKKRIAIQGNEGSFHHLAAMKHWGHDIAIRPCPSFEAVIAAVMESDETGLMAVENTIVGSIADNYALIRNHRLSVTAEIALSIRQNLLALPDTDLEDIREIRSHPAALKQCSVFLSPFGWKLVADCDTATAAAEVARRQEKHIAAIGSGLAAELHGLQILAPGIQDDKQNQTRFWIIENTRHLPLGTL